MTTWSSGRVVLLDDAAWCARPLSGLGTALGLHGAEALSDALADGAVLDDPAVLAAALGGYERTMRPAPPRRSSSLRAGSR